MNTTERTEARILGANNVLVAPSALEGEGSIRDFCGSVITTDGLSSGLLSFSQKTVYLCGNVSRVVSHAFNAAYTFSQALAFHVAVAWLCVVRYNFGWAVRTLRVKTQADPPRYQPRAPAMAAGITDHLWTLKDIFNSAALPTRANGAK